MTVKLTGDNKILLDGEVVSQKEMSKQLKVFIKKQKNEHHVFLLNERGTEYSFYCKIQEHIIGIYQELRNEKSIVLFNKPYDELEDYEQNIIEKIYPQNISEADPEETAKHS